MEIPSVGEKEESKIWEKVYHTDARVSAMEGQLSDLSAGVQRIESHLLNKPRENILSWVIAAAGALWGVAMYIDMSLEPIEDVQQRNMEVVTVFREFKEEVHYEMGILHEWKRHIDSHHTADGGTNPHK